MNADKKKKSRRPMAKRKRSNKPVPRGLAEKIYFEINLAKVKPAPVPKGRVVSYMIEEDREIGCYVRKVKYSSGEESVTLEGPI